MPNYLRVHGSTRRPRLAKFDVVLQSARALKWLAGASVHGTPNEYAKTIARTLGPLDRARLGRTHARPRLAATAGADRGALWGRGQYRHDCPHHRGAARGGCLAPVRGGA